MIFWGQHFLNLAALAWTASVAAPTLGDAGQFVALVGVPAAFAFALLWLAWRIFLLIQPDLAAWLRAHAALAQSLQSELSQLRTVVEANTRAIDDLRRELTRGGAGP